MEKGKTSAASSERFEYQKPPHFHFVPFFFSRSVFFSHGTPDASIELHQEISISNFFAIQNTVNVVTFNGWHVDRRYVQVIWKTRGAGFCAANVNGKFVAAYQASNFEAKHLAYWKSLKAQKHRINASIECHLHVNARLLSDAYKS